MNGYICIDRKGKKYEVYADNTLDAQTKCDQENKIKKQYEISVYLCEKNGEQVTQSTAF